MLQIVKQRVLPIFVSLFQWRRFDLSEQEMHRCKWYKLLILAGFHLAASVSGPAILHIGHCHSGLMGQQHKTEPSFKLEILKVKKSFQVTVTLTFDHQILFSSSLSASEGLYQIWRNSLEVFLRCCVHNTTNDFCKVTATFTFDQ